MNELDEQKKMDILNRLCSLALSDNLIIVQCDGGEIVLCEYYESEENGKVDSITRPFSKLLTKDEKMTLILEGKTPEIAENGEDQYIDNLIVDEPHEQNTYKTEKDTIDKDSLYI